MTLDEIKARIDLEDLAEKLGLVKPKGGKVYRSPHRKDTNPSLSIYDHGRKWKDHATNECGDAFDLVAHVRQCDGREAIQWIRDAYNFPRAPKAQAEPRREKTKPEYIAEKCLAREVAQLVVPYLTEERKIPAAIVHEAIRAGALGYNLWTSPTTAAGNVGHGGPAAAFIVRDLRQGTGTGEVKAVDLRYIDPSVNGGVKTQTQGEKVGHPWCMDRRKLAKARTVYVVESAINALCVEACAIPFTSSFSIRGVGNVRNIDWRQFRGQQLVVALDADMPNDEGRRPGPEAAWEIYDACTAVDVACVLVDQASWYASKLNDVNDVLKARNIDGLREALREFEPWAIAGMPGRDVIQGARRRIFLPSHDWAIYWRFRTRLDFTSYISKFEQGGADGDEDGDGEKSGPKNMQFDDVAGFRIAAISRVQIQSAAATMSGEEDASPRVVFAASVQTPRHGPKLLRAVLSDDRLHNVEHWKKLGPVFNPAKFGRMLSILERSADLGARDAVNFVGLAFRNGQPVMLQGPDCYFAEPEKQCPYHGLSFPSGSRQDAARVLQAYTNTFTGNAAAILLTWALGAHLKAFLGFWPHFELRARKSSGKSTLCKALERTIAFTMFGGQSLETSFRLLCNISHTSHPVGWEEISKRKMETIQAALGFLQEAYQHSVTHRGPELTEFLQCAPVLLAGEDVPMADLTGKLVRSMLDQQGPPITHDLPRFPVREWIQWLCQFDRKRVLELQKEWEDWLRPQCSANLRGDGGARRMLVNYSCIALAHALLREFCDLPQLGDAFQADLVRTMNGHIIGTESEREPYIWILETVLADIDSGNYELPHRFIEMDLDKPDAGGVSRPHCLVLRPSHIVQHMSTSPRLRAKWDASPIKSSKGLAEQLLASPGLVVNQNLDIKIRSTRAQHMWALNVSALQRLGLYVNVPDVPSDGAE